MHPQRGYKGPRVGFTRCVLATAAKLQLTGYERQRGNNGRLAVARCVRRLHAMATIAEPGAASPDPDTEQPPRTRDRIEDALLLVAVVAMGVTVLLSVFGR